MIEDNRIYHPTPGHDALWGWFGLSYASWITIPRVMAHAMPDDWQQRMFDLLTEFDEAFPGKHAPDMPHPIVSAMLGRRFTKWPDWLLNYRHPDREEIERLRRDPYASSQVQQS